MKKGFSIIEVLISTTIIAVILGGLVAIGRNVLANNMVLSEKTQAVYLAQEGIEIVRQIRDTNWVDASNTTLWDWWKQDGENLAQITPGRYGISHIKLPGYNYALNQNLTEKIQLDENDTTYNRTILIEKSDNLYTKSEDVLAGNSYKVTVEVTWGKSSTKISEILTNWRPNY